MYVEREDSIINTTFDVFELVKQFFLQSDTTRTGGPSSSSSHSCQSRRKQARAKEKGRFHTYVDSSTLYEQPGSSIIVN